MLSNSSGISTSDVLRHEITTARTRFSHACLPVNWPVGGADSSGDPNEHTHPVVNRLRERRIASCAPPFCGPGLTTPLTPHDSISKRMSKRKDRVILAVLVLFGINLLNFYDRNAPGALVEPLRHEFSLSDTQIGLLGSAF